MDAGPNWNVPQEDRERGAVVEVATAPDDTRSKRRRIRRAKAVSILREHRDPPRRRLPDDFVADMAHRAGDEQRHARPIPGASPGGQKWHDTPCPGATSCHASVPVTA